MSLNGPVAGFLYGEPQSGQRMVPVRQVYLPDPAVKEMFDRQYRVFTNLYRSNRKKVAVLNRKGM